MAKYMKIFIAGNPRPVEGPGTSPASQLVIPRDDVYTRQTIRKPTGLESLFFLEVEGELLKKLGGGLPNDHKYQSAGSGSRPLRTIIADAKRVANKKKKDIVYIAPDFEPRTKVPHEINPSVMDNIPVNSIDYYVNGMIIFAFDKMTS